MLVRKMKEEDAREDLMESCVSVRRKEVKSGRIMWKGECMKKMIRIIMWKEMQ